MLRNYLITAYRNLTRYKIYALLNISGLGLAIGCSLVIYRVVDYELGFDTFRDNYDNIYRVVREIQIPSGTEYDSGVPFPTGNGIKNDFPDIDGVASIMAWNGLISLENGDKFDEEAGVGFTESSFLEIFGFNVIHGKRKEYLTNPDEALISENLASKYFGYNGHNAEAVIGKSVEVDNTSKFVISGIFERQPDQTDFDFNLLLPYESQKEINSFFDITSWDITFGENRVFLLLNDQTDIQGFEAGLEPFLDKYMEKDRALNTTFRLLPLHKEHFSRNYPNFSKRIARKDFLLAFSLIGLFLIITGSVNFINMATAQSVLRLKEMGIRKVLGGQQFQLIIQVLAETFMITFIAVIVSLGLAEVMLVNLQSIIGYRLSVGLFDTYDVPLLMLVALASITVLSGLYPAILLSKTSSLSAMKVKTLNGGAAGSINIRRGLVIFQFSISQFLIFATLVINSQMKYFENAPLGFRKDNIVLFELPENDPHKLELMRNRLINHSNIEEVSFAFGSPLSDNNATSGFIYSKSGSDDRHQTNFKLVDEHYIDLYELEVIAGRKLRSSDDSVIVINETMAGKMGMSNPYDAIGETVQVWGNRSIVGVVKDFHTYSLHEEKVSTILLKSPEYFYTGQVRLPHESSQASIKESLELIELVWSEAFPDYLFSYRFMDEFIADQYESERRLASLYKIFSLLAIFIGCLGLYGLMSFIANQKTKEIGIRKVLGATVSNIITIFSKELVILILIAFVIATPLAYIVTKDWLNDFSYRVAVGFNVFATAFGVTLFIALVTMGYNSIRASYANPIDSLRYE